MRRTSFCLEFGLFVAMCTPFLIAGSPPRKSGTSTRLISRYEGLPLSFQQNRGQTDPRVQYLARGRSFTLFLTKQEAVLALRRNEMVGGGKQQPSAVLRMRLSRANPSPHVVGLNLLPGVSNYFIGNDRSKWLSGVPHYARVEYRQVYPHVNLAYYGSDGRLEYDFIVEPGGSTRNIRLGLDGLDNLSIDGKGDLLIHGSGQEVVLHKLVAYQWSASERHQIQAGYVLDGSNAVGFDVGPYDHRKTLIIDPVLIYSTYLGGSQDDFATAIALDREGNAYIVGDTNSSDFPITPGAFQTTTPSRNGQAFVTKFNRSGSGLVYSTYLGGSSNSEIGLGVAVDDWGNAYVTGRAGSTDFPITPGAFQTTCKETPFCMSGFVTKLNRNGNGLVYSTYLGGSVQDGGNGIAVDRHGRAYVTGFTCSPNFPTLNSIQGYGGACDAFVSKFNNSGTALVFSTYLGGSSIDLGTGISVDEKEQVAVTGTTISSDFPTKDPIQGSIAGSADVFVTKLTPGGDALVYSTYLGGAGSDGAGGIASDRFGNAFITGSTCSSNFPTANAIQPAKKGDCTAFVSKIRPDGSALHFSTYFGGSSEDFGTGIGVDRVGHVYVTGSTSSKDFPTTPNAIQKSGSGPCGPEPERMFCSDAFLSEFDADGDRLVFSTLLGGRKGVHSDSANGIAISRQGSAYIVGATDSQDFPVTPHAFQETNRGAFSNAFVSKIGHGPHGEDDDDNNDDQ